MRDFIQLCDSIVNNVSCLLIGYWRLQSSPKIFRKWILKGLLFTWSLFRTSSLILVTILTGELMQHLKICLPIAWYGDYVADNWSLLVFPLSFKINMFFYSNATAVKILFFFYSKLICLFVFFLKQVSERPGVIIGYVCLSSCWFARQCTGKIFGHFSEIFNFRVLPLLPQNKMQLLSRFFSCSKLICSFGFWAKNSFATGFKFVNV